MSERIGDYIQTYTSVKFYPLDPRASEIRIEDIAHGLSNICRFNGQSIKFYSVAEHSVHISNHVPLEYALWGLLHDAPEAYISDVPRPIKKSIPIFSEIEDKIMNKVCEKFNLVGEMPSEVKNIDNRILTDERYALMGSSDWNPIEEGLDVSIECWKPETAKQMFLKRFLELF